jgi:hypothetical protein
MERVPWRDAVQRTQLVRRGGEGGELFTMQYRMLFFLDLLESKTYSVILCKYMNNKDLVDDGQT